ncbi:protein tyrosine phosphatase [Dyadobacter soli]|uniref:Protein tyrosine phosphatase n=2 Tax=Dyadobacter soli TaxID=659014 RepID=A0A1G7MB85_9BACT|nr:protein tyrosine phosphatase [Dyadobacter soli]
MALHANQVPAVANYQSITSMKRILVLCTGNSARSQLAQGYLQHFAGDRAEVYSAGVDPKGVNPVAIQVVAEDGLDISHHTARRPGSNHADEYTGIAFDYVITVCDNAREQCPYFPSAGEWFHHSFSDPGHTAPADRPGEDLVTSFRRVRDEIKEYSREFIHQKLPA